MKMQDRVAIAGAIAHAAKKLDENERAAYVKWATENGIKTSEPSIGGTLTVAKRDPKPTLLADDFEQWMAEHQPHNVDTVIKVKPAAERAILAQLVVDGDVVVWKETGEVCSFAVPSPGGQPYASWRGGDEPKAEAEAWFEGRFEHVAELMMSDRKAVES